MAKHSKPVPTTSPTGGGKKKGLKSPSGDIEVCRNRRAKQRFVVEEVLEAGMVLLGSEVKSVRARRADLEGSYASLDGDEVVLHRMHIAPYELATAFPHEPKRPRKLLLRRSEIEKIRGRLTHKGYTLVPLRIYLRRGFAKVELGLATGRQLGDRREEIKRSQELREAKAAMQRVKR